MIKTKERPLTVKQALLREETVEKLTNRVKELARELEVARVVLNEFERYGENNS